MTNLVYRNVHGRSSDPSGHTLLVEEFERLVQSHHGRAYATAYRLMGNSSDAEDLTQDAFVRVWAAFESYDRSRPFEAWLFRILTNLAIDRWRRQSNLCICSLDADGQGGRNAVSRSRGAGASSPQDGWKSTLWSCLADDRPGVMPEQAYLRGETAHRVRKALSEMPGHYRKTVVLADVQGYTYEEIAQQVGCQIGTVRSRLHRGRQMLRQNILKLQEYEEAEIGRVNRKEGGDLLAAGPHLMPLKPKKRVSKPTNSH